MRDPQRHKSIHQRQIYLRALLIKRTKSDEENDEQSTILSPRSIPRTSRFAKYHDKAVTSKTPPSSEDESSEADDEVKNPTTSYSKESGSALRRTEI